MSNFWQDLPKPFFVLAPMDDVTDSPFRRVVAGLASPDVFVTEFGNATGMQSNGRHKVEQKFYVHPDESGTKLVAQVWGNVPEHYYETVKELVATGHFSGIDINMGCPEKGIVARGCCAGLINNPPLAAEIIQRVKDAAGDLPVSVKTRIGFKTITTEDWIGHLLQQNIDVLTIHGRTQKEMTKVPAHWDEIGKVVKLRDELAPTTLIIGNGDVRDRAHGLELAEQYGVDGIMIGRGVFHNPWTFEHTPTEHSPAAGLAALKHHLELYQATWGDKKSYEPLKRFYKIYLLGFPGAADIRLRFMLTHSYDEARVVLAEVATELAI